MRPKPPPPPPLPPVVPPIYLVISENSAEEFEESARQALSYGMMPDPNTMQINSVAGSVVFSQAFVRDPAWERQVRTRESTQGVMEILSL